MKQGDYGNFHKLMADVFGFYEKPLSQFAMQVWWKAAKRYEFAAISDALSRHLMNPTSGKWLPTPADLVAMMEGSTKDRSMVAWAKVDKAVRIKGVYVDVVFDDPLIHRVLHDMGGWIMLGDKQDDEWPFVAKEFQNRYAGYAEQGARPEYPPVLIGSFNAHNASRGLPFREDCVFVGKEEDCRLVYDNGNSKPLVEFKAVSQSEKRLESPKKLLGVVPDPLLEGETAD